MCPAVVALCAAVAVAIITQVRQLRQVSWGEKDRLYVLGLSHSHYGLTGLYVIGKCHLKAVLSGERKAAAENDTLCC